MAIDADIRLTVVGFAAALAILGVLFWLIGVDEVSAALAPLRPSIVMVICAVALGWLAAWGMALFVVLRVLGVDLPIRAALLLFVTAQFSNNITPFGQAGGEPISALFISRRVDVEYETGLAAIASVDALNFVPSIVLAVGGLAYYSMRFTLGPRLEYALFVVATLAVGVPTVGYLVWRFRGHLADHVTRILTPFARLVSRTIPRRSVPTREAIRGRVDGFYRDIGRIGNDRERLVVALAFSGLGWLALAASLWLSLFALGVTVGFSAVLVIVPVAAIAGVTPFPGGLGGVETVIVLLLISMTPITAGVAGAAALVHRLATYWLPIAIGGGAAAVISVDGRRRIAP